VQEVLRVPLHAEGKKALPVDFDGFGDPVVRARTDPKTWRRLIDGLVMRAVHQNNVTRVRLRDHLERQR
jgi:hypothetical protein